ncbi:hypothetical protein AB0O39_27410 [Streptomyces anulatus]|uniref:hypothetical protein n=1 Tax=Streptomyces anulatus TaxID=1892 RepID=UPI0034374DDC
MAISTPRLDSLTADGTNEVFDGIRLADSLTLTLKVAPGADTAEVFLFPGLDAPEAEAWENEDRWESWLTDGEFGNGSLYLDVPVAAVRDLIVEHGGEHDNQESPGESPAGAEEGVTAEAIAIRALAERGLTAERVEDAGDSWLVIDNGSSRAVLCLFERDGDETNIDRPVNPEHDNWYAAKVDAKGNEGMLTYQPADGLADCVQAIVSWRDASNRPSTSTPHLDKLTAAAAPAETGEDDGSVRLADGRP